MSVSASPIEMQELINTFGRLLYWIGRKECHGCVPSHTVQLCDLLVFGIYSWAPALQCGVLHECMYCPAVPGGQQLPRFTLCLQAVSSLIASTFLCCFSDILHIEDLNQSAGLDLHGCSQNLWLDWYLGVRFWDLYLLSVNRLELDLSSVWRAI